MYKLFDKDGVLTGTIEEIGDLGCGGAIVVAVLGLVFLVMFFALLKVIWWLLLVQALVSISISYLLTRLLKKQITSLNTISNICGTVCFAMVMISSYFLYLDYFTMGDFTETLVTIMVWIWAVVFAYVIASLAAGLVRKKFGADNA